MNFCKYSSYTPCTKNESQHGVQGQSDESSLHSFWKASSIRVICGYTGNICNPRVEEKTELSLAELMFSLLSFPSLKIVKYSVATYNAAMIS